MLFGILWGFAQLGNGISVHRLGFAISNALIIGIGAAFGTLLPLILLHRGMLFAPTGLLILFGTALMITGVALCGWAGYQREEAARSQGRQSPFPQKEAALSHSTSTRGRYILDLAIGAVSGALGSLLNVALGYGGDIIAKVEAEGGRASLAPFAVWPIVLCGGSLVNVSYASYLLSINHTWSRFITNTAITGVKETLNPMLAGCLWMGGVALYSSGTTYLGVLGVSVGFALFMSLVVVCGQAAAVITGEWKGFESALYRHVISGIALLFLAIAAIGAANYVK
jgi:L-rhamnose-H+ transport protein